MLTEVGDRKRIRFRRISRARIFDGPVLNVGMYAAAVMVLTYVLITAAISLLFAYFHKVDFGLTAWALLPGALLGYMLLVAERLLGHLKTFLVPGMGKLLTAFLLFFAHTISYLFFSSVIISYPMGIVLEEFWQAPGMGGEYSLFSVNFFIVLAIMSWLRNVRTPPCRCW